ARRRRAVCPARGASARRSAGADGMGSPPFERRGRARTGRGDDAHPSVAVRRSAAHRDRVLLSRSSRRRHARRRHPRHRRRRRQRPARSAGGSGGACRRARRCALRSRAAGAACRRRTCGRGRLGADTGGIRRPRARPRRARCVAVKPRVLFVSRRVETPLPEGERRKWDAIREQIDFRILAAGNPDGEEFPLFPEPPVLAGPAYYAALPVRIARELRRFRPQAVLAQGAHETAAALAARKLAGIDTAVIADVHGDFRAPTRLYGSRLRGTLSVVADRTARTALRRADGIRTVTGYTTALVRELGLEPADEFPAYMDFASFLQSPPALLPERPQALLVGVLERYKNVDGLAAAWRGVAASVPGARLRVVGTGALAETVERLVAEVPDVEWTRRLSQPDVACALDESTCLVLPSRSE